MASEVKTNKLSPSTSTTVTLGDASDLFQLPASAEIDIASGATLDVNGTIDLTGATTTGFPAGGLTAASQWRLTAAFNGGLSPIAANLEEVDAPAGFGVLGSSMTESSGIFTFPSSGYWLVRFNPLCKVQDGWAVTYIYAKIVTTDDDSTWVEAARASQMKNIVTSPAANVYVSCSLEYIFDVVSTSTHKVQFWINPSGTGVDTQGDSGYNETHMTFLRLADT